MDDEQNIHDLIASYALGSLDKEEVAQVEALLAESHTAREELAQYQQVTDLMGLAVPTMEPSATFDDRLFARISPAPAAVQSGVSRTKPQPQAQPKLSFLEQLSAFFAKPALQMAGGLAMILLLFSSGLLMMQNRQIESELAIAQINRGLPTFELASNSGLESNTGLIVMSLDGVNGTVIVDGMQLPADDSQYQLWLIEDGEVEAGPLLDLNDQGYGARWVRSGKPLEDYNHFMVTLEPAGGSERPTSEPVLEWIEDHGSDR
ncbi:MAG: anti-sigma factor [Anaerolineae bacterium]